LRFPEFQGEWEEKTLGECSTSLDYGMNASAIKYDGQNKYIRITDIDETSSKYISNNPVSPEGELCDRYLVQENDILFARTGASTGKTYIYNKQDGKLYFAGFLIRARIRQEYNASFVFAQTQTLRYDKWVKLMSMGSGQPGINSQEYAGYRISLPKKREQEKIASFLSLIDERIVTQNKIIEQYKSLIKGLTHFALNGKQANVRLMDCVVCNSSALTESEFEGINGLHPVYGATGIIAYSPQYAVDEDSILVIKDGANVGRVQYVSGKYSTIGTLNYLTTKNDFSLRYIYYLLRCLNFDKYKVGSGIPHIYFKDYGNELIYCPPIEEQKKIARILSSIEEKLNIEMFLLETYTLQKEYLLRNVII
jgi:type I restriction enzyme S subunit